MTRSHKQVDHGWKELLYFHIIWVHFESDTHHYNREKDLLTFINISVFPLLTPNSHIMEIFTDCREQDVAGIDVNMGCPKEFSIKVPLFTILSVTLWLIILNLVCRCTQIHVSHRSLDDTSPFSCILMSLCLSMDDTILNIDNGLVNNSSVKRRTIVKPLSKQRTVSSVTVKSNTCILNCNQDTNYHRKTIKL